MIKTLIQGILHTLGYEVRRSHIGFHSSYLSQVCQPKTVIDVGVGYGTFPLYRAFPDAHFILIEPLDDYKQFIDRIAKKYDCEAHYTAIGSREGEVEINVEAGDLQRSSFAERTSLTTSENPLSKRLVSVKTLDALYEHASGWDGPILLKVDTEGHELGALEGARVLLRDVDTVILEVSVAKRFEHSYEFEDIIVFMKQRGFFVFSFLEMACPRNELRQRHVDILFKRRLE